MSLKFGYLGIWHSHSVLHVKDAGKRPSELELIGIYEPDPEILESKLNQWANYLPDDLIIFDSIEEVLNSDAEAIICEGRVSENLDYAEKALNAGKHVLLEKPAGVDLDQLQKLHQIAQRKRLHLQMAYMWRYNPAIAEVIRLVRAGALGQLFYFRGHIPKPLSYYSRLTQELDCYKGSLYFEMAGHLVDIMVTLMGKPKAIHPTLTEHYAEKKYVDNAVVVHVFDDNSLGTIDTASIQTERNKTRRIEEYGTRGTVIHTPTGSNNLQLFLEQPFENYVKGWQDVIVPTPFEEPSLLTELSACISNMKEPDYSLHHDMTVQQVLFEACGIKDGSAMIPSLK